MENNETTPQKETTGAAASVFKPVPETLTQNEALSVLVQAAVFAQSKGIFALEDAEIISKAVRTFVRKDDVPAETPAK